MKAFVIITVARQVQGEYCFVKSEKGFASEQKANDYANGLAKRFSEKINTPSGQIDCVCERGVFEIEIEE